MENRVIEIKRETKETVIYVKLNLDGQGNYDISTDIPFFDHMLSCFSLHGFFDISVNIKGDTEIDYHHSVEDAGIVIGDAINKALVDRAKIKRYGFAATPMDDALAEVFIDLSKRPYLVYNICDIPKQHGNFDIYLAKEFFRALSVHAGINLHINVRYGENEHHIIEAIFKSFGRALSEAVSFDERIKNIRSTKGIL
jgi:imidazoleglycerol-phosphate dehydratase